MQPKKQSNTSARFFLHLAVATAIFVIAEIQFITRTNALLIGLAVAVLGMMFFKTRTHPLLLLFPGAMLATAIWSPAPTFTLMSLGTILIPLILAGTVARISGPVRFIRTLAFWARISLLLSFAVFLIRPDLGAHQDFLYDGAMQGLFAHKNGLARILVIGVFAEVFAQQRTFTRLFWLGVFLVAAMLTNSLSFFVLIAAVIVGALVLHAVNWRSPLAVTRFVAFCHPLFAVALILSFTVLPRLVEESGRFTEDGDRGRIWRGVMTLFEIKPLGGWGYGQVFQPDTTAGQFLFSTIGWIPTAAHSGYMNALAEGGLLGISALVLTFLGAMVVTWKARAFMLWPFVYASVLLLNNLTDTRTASVEWFILATAVLYAVAVKRGGSHLLPEPVPREKVKRGSKIKYRHRPAPQIKLHTSSRPLRS